MSCKYPLNKPLSALTISSFHTSVAARSLQFQVRLGESFYAASIAHLPALIELVVALLLLFLEERVCVVVPLGALLVLLPLLELCALSRHLNGLENADQKRADAEHEREQAKAQPQSLVPRQGWRRAAIAPRELLGAGALAGLLAHTRTLAPHAFGLLETLVAGAETTAVVDNAVEASLAGRASKVGRANALAAVAGEVLVRAEAVAR